MENHKWQNLCHQETLDNFQPLVALEKTIQVSEHKVLIKVSQNRPIAILSEMRDKS